MTITLITVVTISIGLSKGLVEANIVCQDTKGQCIKSATMNFINTGDADACAKHCSENIIGSTWFTFYQKKSEDSLCVCFANCLSFDFKCDNCVSRPTSCATSEEGSELAKEEEDEGKKSSEQSQSASSHDEGADDDEKEEEEEDESEEEEEADEQEGERNQNRYFYGHRAFQREGPRHHKPTIASTTATATATTTSPSTTVKADDDEPVVQWMHLECERSGKCQGQSIRIVEALTSQQCRSECQKEKKCLWYTISHHDAKCQLFDSCPGDFIGTPCKGGCTSFNIKCQKDL